MDETTLRFIIVAFVAGALPTLFVLWKKRPQQKPPWERASKSDLPSRAGEQVDPPK